MIEIKLVSTAGGGKGLEAPAGVLNLRALNPVVCMLHRNYKIIEMYGKKGIED